MNRIFIACLLLVMAGCSGQSSSDSAEAAPVALKWAQRTCPYQPKIIDPGLFHDWEGKRIYTCCESCLPIVREDPQAAIDKLAQRGEYVLSIEEAKKREAELGPFDYAELPGLDDIFE